MLNRPSQSCPYVLFLSEAKCASIYMKMIFYSHANETYFHKNGFATSLVLKVSF